MTPTVDVRPLGEMFLVTCSACGDIADVNHRQHADAIATRHAWLAHKIERTYEA